MDLSREECKQRVQEQVTERSDDALIVFTDGSYLQDTGGGAAAASTEEVRTATFTPPAAFSNNEMECMGIALGIAQFIDRIRTGDTEKTTIAIFSDSQAALRAAHYPTRATSGQSLVKFLKSQFKRLPAGTNLELFWTPGHEGIPLNEAADKAAKQAAEADGGKTTLPTSLTNLLQSTWTLLSLSSSDFPNHTRTFKTAAKKIADALNGLEKGHAAAIFQLRTGHCPLNSYLHRFKRAPSKYCRTCGVPETVPHFLLYCRRYRSQRANFRKRIREEKIKVNLYNANAVLDEPATFPLLAEFVLDTGRFEHLHSYLPDPDPGPKG
ncbi:hypothetical protein CROQUDRAFT_666509 [Cronartium quercuum f. sp. fusiforme G11]|uniref:RNase H type-1 domain-containing protein n=1 Tax=Cronartium quercuum f. sp. fusiforme G11 TaxID=708437 RepID=A0A9P6N599_9BASI|nr:hypothetical protein CROQUDRAFT_666509 [Cronartium quercuum f. sp. fusiforme G11]